MEKGSDTMMTDCSLIHAQPRLTLESRGPSVRKGDWERRGAGERDKERETENETSLAKVKGKMEVKT